MNITWEIGEEEDLSNNDIDEWVVLPSLCKRRCSKANPDIHMNACENAIKCRSCGRNQSLPAFITKQYPKCCSVYH